MATPINIQGKSYRVQRLDPAKAVASSAVRIYKPDGEFYDIAKFPHGIECTCWSFISRGNCKHVDACKGLLK